MPVTPLHLGVGLLGKGTLPRQVSLTAFAVSQVAIDVEVAYSLFIAHSWPLHRWAHTFVGAVVVGIASALAVWIGGTWAIARLGPRWQVPDLREASLLPALVGGLLGGLTHTALDGLMHDDVSPLLPFSTANPLAGLVPYSVLATGLAVAALVGVVLIAAAFRRRCRWVKP